MFDEQATGSIKTRAKFSQRCPLSRRSQRRRSPRPRSPVPRRGRRCVARSYSAEHLRFIPFSRAQLAPRFYRFCHRLESLLTPPQKWSKGRSKDKLNNLVLYDKATYEKMLKDVPVMKLITVSIISDRLRANGSLARKTIRELENKGLIRRVARHSSQLIYTRTSAS
jgi:small subunit ribosomal protein S25e